VGQVAKRQPLRRCIMCRRSSPKGELLRFVATASGIEWDASHQLPGRGAYVHKGMSCWGKIMERSRWEHALRGRSAITQEVLRGLQQRTRSEVPELLVDRMGDGALDVASESQRKELGQKVRL
jgi:predicted RNA-binding protein YlxR (DUF448 family)